MPSTPQAHRAPAAPPVSNAGPTKAYILLVLLVICTSDDAYLETLCSVSVPHPDWLSDAGRRRSTAPTPLASIVGAAVLRVMQVNLSSTVDRDSFVHTCCVAVMGNLSRAWRGIDAAFATRLVAWTEVIVRRLARLRAADGDGGGVEQASRVPLPASVPQTPIHALGPGLSGNGFESSLSLPDPLMHYRDTSRRSSIWQESISLNPVHSFPPCIMIETRQAG